MLEIKNLNVEIQGNKILKGINLNMKAGEIHAIMGPNGSGKSTLAKTVAGHPDYIVTGGEIFLHSKDNTRSDLLALEPDQRAREGIFLGFQYPVEIPGVTNLSFLWEAATDVALYQKRKPKNKKDFIEYAKEKLHFLDMDENFLNRPVNVGFSGGEKKKNEILQMALLEPRVAFLDETDSGLDIDALKIVANGVNHLKNSNNTIVLITHYQRLLDYIRPDFIHVLYNGKIIRTGGHELALELEKRGYDWIVNENKQ
ncbi:MAG: Fe-S cluster assembly ATPase SufC [Bdellovibrionales bacterium RIFOXYD12_FULL_39_22]|nr:MAG: Fe-S cluster assembly ATPase SufC [Bdellovibrionales bacterium RIFOXYB1_FULL_39_21]OFZ44346.1 MAG: Fe-S cluster assembly ATPase SufC [Bdellovibrionales bacterium RIFOXYC12_FULL_39_17]OFZ49201.1 MAG: Fe-S cluster assembly ATPase SufC [Bdellovibrionales bacterium RIFOXYC1_FULL_39_130]OFZ73766.1 MAG: Fe-S cluster assembly ATPase SufC [Bdellovibrionales bacterium RIFOXYC2_FULL_39_8]OFZ77009.1 MAG: Fe-S cluster assembly ATPase SufC [Bdellovibrionales bacterium RIFOXYD1_FULL_39_84]OFZ95222.1